MRCAGAILATAALFGCAAAFSNSSLNPAGTAFEIDLVFPRNGTYAPAHLLPIIFAIQNPQAGEGLLTDLVITVYRGDWLSGNSSIALDINHLADVNLSTVDNEPYFLVLASPALNGTEGHFALQYEFGFLNCSATERDPRYEGLDDNPKRNISQFRDVVEFTLRNDAPAAVDGFHTSRDDCPVPVGTFNVTGSLPWDNTYRYKRPPTRTLCGVLTEPTPSAVPCAVQVNRALAADLSTRVTETACSWGDPFPTLNCKKSLAAGRPTTDSIVWLAMAFALLYGFP